MKYVDFSFIGPQRPLPLRTPGGSDPSASTSAPTIISTMAQVGNTNQRPEQRLHQRPKQRLHQRPAEAMPRPSMEGSPTKSATGPSTWSNRSNKTAYSGRKSEISPWRLQASGISCQRPSTAKNNEVRPWRLEAGQNCRPRPSTATTKPKAKPSVASSLAMKAILHQLKVEAELEIARSRSDSPATAELAAAVKAELAAIVHQLLMGAELAAASRPLRSDGPLEAASRLLATADKAPRPFNAPGAGTRCLEALPACQPSLTERPCKRPC